MAFRNDNYVAYWKYSDLKLIRFVKICYTICCWDIDRRIWNKKAVLPQGNRAMPQVFFSVEVRQQLSLQV